MPSGLSGHVFSQSIGMSSSLGNSPLSSPQLPRHPRSDIWVYPFDTAASNSAYTAPTPIGVLPSGYHAPPPPLPQPIGGKHNPFQRAVGGQMHKGGGGGHHHGNRGLEHRGHSLEEDFLYGNNPFISSAPPGHAPYHHKRWSVPSGMYTPQPPVGGFHPNSSNSPELPTWGPRGGMAGLGNSGVPPPNFQTITANKKAHAAVGMGGGGGGNSLSLTDPWPHWISPVPPPQFPPIVSLPHQQKTDFVVPPPGAPHPRVSRSISTTINDQWTSSSEAPEQGEGKIQGGGRKRGGNGELQQLMKSLDINSEHMQSLKVGGANDYMTCMNVITCMRSAYLVYGC